MYEHRSKPLISLAEFYVRVARHGLLALSVLLVALGIGVLGYRWFDDRDWVDAFLNASMILGGMGPVGDFKYCGGKIFASLYALFSGIVFIGVMGFMLAPFLHRLLHRFHLEDDAEKNSKKTK